MVHESRVEAHLPPDCEVRILTITDKQIEWMRIFWGKSERVLSNLLINWNCISHPLALKSLRRSHLVVHAV